MAILWCFAPGCRANFDAFCTKIAVFSPKTCIVQKIVLPLHRFYGDSLAQLVEHIPFKDGVVGSNPTRITTKTAGTTACGLSFYPPHPQSKTASYFWISELICTFVVLVWDSLVLFRNTGWVVSSSMGHILCAAFAALGANH